MRRINLIPQTEATFSTLIGNSASGRFCFAFRGSFEHSPDLPTKIKKDQLFWAGLVAIAQIQPRLLSSKTSTFT
jgi:hypothetical protein